MRHAQAGLVDDLVAVEEQVEVDDPRPPKVLSRTRPSPPFDRQQRSSSARAASPVSSAAAPFRNLG